MSGKKMTVEEVMEVVEQDRNFYETSGGGVTFSGGEPLLQFRFLRELLKESKNRGFHTAVETAGNVEWQAFEEIVELTDLFLYDIKVLDRKKHIQATGSNNDRCLSNLQQLVRRKANICVRIPVIEHVNDSQEDMQQIADYLSACSHNIPVELLPFHKMGAEKYKGLGIPYRAENTQVPSETKMEKLRKVFPTIVHK